jgi:hypothetical protein
MIKKTIIRAALIKQQATLTDSGLSCGRLGGLGRNANYCGHCSIMIVFHYSSVAMYDDEFPPDGLAGHLLLVKGEPKESPTFRHGRFPVDGVVLEIPAAASKGANNAESTIEPRNNDTTTNTFDHISSLKTHSFYIYS